MKEGDLRDPVVGLVRLDVQTTALGRELIGGAQQVFWKRQLCSNVAYHSGHTHG